MSRKSMLIGLLLFCSLSTFADGVVYEVSKGKQKLYLAGTIHLLRASDFPLPMEYEQAYQRSSKIVFETDMEKAQSPEFGQRFSQSMLLPNQQTLKDVLTPQVWSELQAYADKSQYPLSQTMVFSPAMHSILIVLAESKKMGIGEGVDAFYYKKSKTDNKPLGELESVEDVLSYMQMLKTEDPNITIQSALKEIDELPSLLIQMIGAWRAGNLEEIQKSLGDKMKEESQITYETLVLKRNQKWLPQIEAMLKTPETELVLVGSLHLSGDDGLLKSLKKDGFKVAEAKFTN